MIKYNFGKYCNAHILIPESSVPSRWMQTMMVLEVPTEVGTSCVGHPNTNMACITTNLILRK